MTDRKTKEKGQNTDTKKDNEEEKGKQADRNIEGRKTLKIGIKWKAKTKMEK